MSRKTYRAPKVDIEAVQNSLNAVSKYLTAEQDGCVLYIRQDKYRLGISTDEIIALSLRLFAVHNEFEIQVHYTGLVLVAGVYRILPEYLIKGEEVEYEIEDMVEKECQRYALDIE